MIGPYQLQERIGIGGFATVYRGLDTRFDSPVAIKVLAENWSADVDARIRFANEARLLRQLENPHVIRVYDVGEVDGQPFIAMQLANATLEQVLTARSEPFTTDELSALATTLGSMLDSVHRSDVVHRDIKPSNLLILNDSSTGVAGPEAVDLTASRVVLSDFGLAKDLALSSGMTRPGGTAWFQAPEQLGPASTVDARSDIYSAGAVLAWAVTGSVPDAASSWAHHLSRHRIAGPVQRSLLTALAEERSERPNDGGSWASQFVEALSQSRGVTGPPFTGASLMQPDESDNAAVAPAAELPPPRAPQNTKRRRFPALLGLLGLLIVAVLFAVAPLVVRSSRTQLADQPAGTLTTPEPETIATTAPEPTTRPTSDASPTPEPIATAAPPASATPAPDAASGFLDVCPVEIPADVLVYQGGAIDSRQDLIWVMANANIPQGADGTTVLEPGSLMGTFNGRKIYAKSGAIVGSTGNGGLEGTVIFFEEGAEIVRSNGVASYVELIQCGEIVTSRPPPASIEVPDERPINIDVDLSGPEWLTTISFSPDPTEGVFFRFDKKQQFCLDRVRWNAYGLPTYGPASVTGSITIEQPDAAYTSEAEFTMTVDTHPSVDYDNPDIWGMTAVLRSTCFDDLPGPGEYRYSVRLSLDGAEEPSQSDAYEGSFSLDGIAPG